MASTQKTKKPVSDARKASMKIYYDSKKQQINKNRLLNRIKSGKQKGLQRAKLELYDWTDEEYAFLEPLVNEKVVKKTTTTKPRAVETQQEEQESDTEQTVFTKDQFESALMTDTKTVTDGSKNQWRIVYRNYQRLFDFSDDNFTDFLNVFTDDEIAEILTTAYPNVKTRIKQYQFIPKLRNIMGEPFQKFLTDARYKIWDRKQNEVSQLVKSSNNTRKEETGIDHVPAFINMFKNELQLRSKSPGTVQHALAVVYTIGVYKNISKLDDPTFIPRLDYDDVRLVDDDSQIDSTTKAKWYNLKTGRLLINDLKTDRFYTYDYTLNDTAKKYIDMYLLKTKKKAGEKLFNLSTKKMPEAVKKSIGVGNREYRKAFQNVYHKVFKVKIEQMSNPMGHDVDTAINTYMDSYTYTEPERKNALNAIKTQVALNAK
jgi:hypothetical protein